MNSQIYCLPQKFGWNAMQCTSDARAEKRAEDMERSKVDKGPFFQVQFNQQPTSEEAIRRFKKQYPKLAERCQVSDQEALNAVYKSEYSFKYGPDFTPPYQRPRPPVDHELLADPLLRRSKFHSPFSRLKPPSYNVFDPRRGAHEWRELIPKPGMYIWQPLQKVPVLGNPGQRSTMLPVRVKDHDPNHEKERWDSIRNLVRNDAVAYGYRCHMPGYSGWKLDTEDLSSCVEKDMARPNLAMVSTTHAYHRQFPLLDRRDLGDVRRPIAADSRLVIFGQPQPQLTQPSACE
ncbi:hypothetical protein BsWGS_15892 [Bradybaena similaris]